MQLKTYQHLQINGLIENRLAFYDKGGEIKLNVYQQEIYKTIDTLTDKKLAQLGYDKTKRGKVISVDSTTCIVEIDGDNYTCKIRKGIYVQPNDIVFIKFPQNNNVDKYVDATLGNNEIPEYLIISAEEILDKLKTVDGEGSGLDADMLDGKHGSEFVLKTELNISTFTHNQLSPEKEWNVVHDLNRFPSVNIVDSGGSVVLGDVQYIDENQIKIVFATSFSGKAYLN